MMSLALAGSARVDADVTCGHSSDSTHSVQVANFLMLAATRARLEMAGGRGAVMGMA